MKIEQQVCTLNQAKILKEFGVNQKSIWYWEMMKQPVMEGCATERVQLYANVGHIVPRGVVQAVYSAFTVSELGLMLPDTLIKHFDFPSYKIPESKEYAIDFHTWFCPDQNDYRLFGCRYDHFGNVNIATQTYYGTEAEARAALIIHLIEERLLTVEEINQRMHVLISR